MCRRRVEQVGEVFKASRLVQARRLIAFCPCIGVDSCTFTYIFVAKHHQIPKILNGLDVMPIFLHVKRVVQNFT